MEDRGDYFEYAGTRIDKKRILELPAQSVTFVSQVFIDLGNKTQDLNKFQFRSTLVSLVPVFFLIYGLIFVIALTLNGKLVHAICRMMRRRRICSAHIFLFRLFLGNSLNDLLVKDLIVMPVSLSTLTGVHWVLGPDVCKFFPIVQDSCFYSSSLILLCAFVLRFRHISHSTFHSGTQVIEYAKSVRGHSATAVLLICFAIALCAIIPHTVYIEFVDLGYFFGQPFAGSGVCYVKRNNIMDYVKYLFIIFYVVPVCLSLSYHFKTSDIIDKWEESCHTFATTQRLTIHRGSLIETSSFITSEVQPPSTHSQPPHRGSAALTPPAEDPRPRRLLPSHYHHLPQQQNRNFGSMDEESMESSSNRQLGIHSQQQHGADERSAFASTNTEYHSFTDRSTQRSFRREGRSPQLPVTAVSGETMMSFPSICEMKLLPQEAVAEDEEERAFRQRDYAIGRSGQNASLRIVRRSNPSVNPLLTQSPLTSHIRSVPRSSYVTAMSLSPVSASQDPRASFSADLMAEYDDSRKRRNTINATTTTAVPVITAIPASGNNFSHTSSADGAKGQSLPGASMSLTPDERAACLIRRSSDRSQDEEQQQAYDSRLQTGTAGATVAKNRSSISLVPNISQSGPCVRGRNRTLSYQSARGAGDIVIHCNPTDGSLPEVHVDHVLNAINNNKYSNSSGSGKRQKRREAGDATSEEKNDDENCDEEEESSESHEVDRRKEESLRTSLELEIVIQKTMSRILLFHSLLLLPFNILRFVKHLMPDWDSELSLDMAFLSLVALAFCTMLVLPSVLLPSCLPEYEDGLLAMERETQHNTRHSIKP